MRVLIAVDGSEGAFEAIDQVAPLLTDDRDEVAFYCSPPDVKLRQAFRESSSTRPKNHLQIVSLPTPRSGYARNARKNQRRFWDIKIPDTAS